MNFILNRKWLLYAGGLMVLILACYLLASVANPYFGKKSKVISEVGNFKFINQHGDTITEKILEDKIALSYFFFTSCQGVCPLLNESVKKIVAPFKNEEKFIILAHTCDPDTDTVAKLKMYSDEMELNNERWHLLTGRKKDLYEANRFFYKIHDPQNSTDSNFNFMHTQYMAIVKDGKVLRIIDGLNEKEIKDAIVFLKQLILQVNP